MDPAGRRPRPGPRFRCPSTACRSATTWSFTTTSRYRWTARWSTARPIVNQSAITGENLPVSVAVGAHVHAGSVVVRGRLVVRARAVGNQTAIGRIIARVEEAQHDRAPIQTVGENFSRRFVPTSFIVSAVTLVITGGRAPRDDHAVDRVPLRGGLVHPDRDQRRDRQRRAPRHPDQGRIPPRTGRPGRTRSCSTRPGR